MSSDEENPDFDLYTELLARRNAVKDLRARHEDAKKRSAQARIDLDLSYSEEQALFRELTDAVGKYLEIT